MPQFQQGDIWSVYPQADLFLVTTNSTLKQNGALVMGRGAAQQARDRFPGLDLAFGQAIAQQCGHLGRYHLLVSPQWPQAKMGAFQACTERSRSVKTDYKQSADLSLIQASVAALVEWTAAHPGKSVHLNFPGIGNGGLARADVLPLLAPLPDQVVIWEFGPAVAVEAISPPPYRFLPNAADLAAMEESRDRFFALPADESLPPATHDRQLFACAFFRGAAWALAKNGWRDNGAQSGSPPAKEARCPSPTP
jgi:hypothetical protein